MEIIPTILTDSQKELEQKLSLLTDSGQWVQIDIVDKNFSSKKTLDLNYLDVYSSKNFLWDIHLMVKNPFFWIERCSRTLAQRVVAQVEMMKDQAEFLERVESEGMEAGLALDLTTDISVLKQEALTYCDEVLLLTVKAGKSGQRFNEKIFLKKIGELIGLRQKTQANFKIGVDGGVNLQNIDLIKKSGADIAYVGSGIWTKTDPVLALKKLREH